MVFYSQGGMILQGSLRPSQPSRVSRSCCSPLGSSYIKPHDSPQQHLRGFQHPQISFLFSFFTTSFPPNLVILQPSSPAMSQAALPSEEGECAPSKMRLSSLPIHKKKASRNHKKWQVWGQFSWPQNFNARLDVDYRPVGDGSVI